MTPSKHLLENEHGGAGCHEAVLLVVSASAPRPRGTENGGRKEGKPRKIEPQRNGTGCICLFATQESQAISTFPPGVREKHTGIVNG